MKYVYFASFWMHDHQEPNNMEITCTKEITSIADIEEMETTVHAQGFGCVTILNYQLLRKEN